MNPPPEAHEPLGDQLADLYEAALEAEQDTGPAGETVAEAKHHLLVRVARVGLGLVVLGVGLVLIPLPGPGLLVVAAGLGLMARDVRFAQRWLDRVRERLPETEDGRLASWVIVVTVAWAGVSTGVSFWWAVLR